MARWSEYNTVMALTSQLLLHLVILLVLSAVSPSQQTSPREANNGPQAGPLVLLVSFDGFRWDYLDRTATPNFDNLIKDGVKAKYIYDAFTSKTFPNHYTIVTGLYEESHGIVGNAMYDPVWNETYFMGNESKWWEGGEPIWVTNEKEGGASGVIEWPGMDTKIHNFYPTYRMPKYNQTFPFDARVDIITELFSNGSINLGLLYFREPDHSGHIFGPDSPKMDAVIRMCDDTVGYLMQSLQKAGLGDRVNVIITSDHGMAEVSAERVLQLDDFVDPSLYHYTDNNPVFGIWPHEEDDTELIYSKIYNASSNVKVFLKDAIPAQYHYHDNRRISPILVVADVGWSINRGDHSNDSRKMYKGNHGYNNSVMAMHPIFVANGPSFKKGLLVEPFENVNIYTLICDILGLSPAPNNGSLEKVQGMLRTTEPTSSHLLTKLSADVTYNKLTTGGSPEEMDTSTIIGMAVVGGVAFLAVCLLIAMCAKQRSYRQPPTQYAPIADTSLDNVDELGFQSYNYPNTKI
ncbi:ectonucleotide pyrophosphatase/phosphodiesterase family member 5-like [Asterias amurensis]|uniref:ectonucleotide pyrophosphatase/phosphodiesterase family member 5-like n=1 Tax=Asterias amurensis TaxID=7602 RepID=UPI003AB34EB4